MQRDATKPVEAAPCATPTLFEENHKMAYTKGDLAMFESRETNALGPGKHSSCQRAKAALAERPIWHAAATSIAAKRCPSPLCGVSPH